MKIKTWFAIAAIIATTGAAGVASADGYWTGFYVGGTIGFGNGNSDHGDSVGQTGGAPTFPVTDPEGAVYGIMLGYNHQFTNNVVLGFEADYSWSDMEGSAGSTATYGCLATNCVTEIDSFATARVRLGYAMDNFMPYVTAGIARTEYTGTLGTSGTVTQNSNVYGIGVEYGVTREFSVRGEILMVTDPGSFVFNPANCLAPGCGLRDNDYSVLRIGATYRF